VDEKKFEESFFDGIFDFTLDRAYLDEMFRLVRDHESFLLGIIAKYAPKFDLESMNRATLIATCIGAGEMYFFSEDIPAKVSLNEAVEIAKVYGDESSKKIVNGILNSFFEDIKAGKNLDIQEQTHLHFFVK